MLITLIKGYTYISTFSERILKVVTEVKECLDIFKQFHGSPAGGHQGINKTVDAVKQRFFWPGLTSHITQLVSSKL